jgi:hypothetical protein
MRFLTLSILSIFTNVAMAAYSPTAVDRRNLYAMQANNFSIQANVNGDSLSDISFGAGASGRRYCVVSFDSGADQTYLGSRLGTRWTIGTTPANTTLFGVGFSVPQDIFIAVGHTGGSTPLVMTSTDCLSWTTRTSPDANIHRAVASNGSIIVAVGGNVGSSNCAIMSSPTGTTWTTATISSGTCTGGEALFSVTWNGSKFVAVGSKSYATSVNGTSWTVGTIPHAGIYNSVTWDGKKFWASSNTAPTYLISSTDGETWSAVGFSLGGMEGIKWTGNYLIASVSNPTNFFNGAYSIDGTTWKGFYLPSQARRFAVDGYRVLGILGSPAVSTESIIRSMALDFTFWYY